MSEPTLADVFGPNATQDANSITISKTDLANYGLTPSAANTAESIYVAILLQSAVELTSNNFSLNEPNQQIAIGIAGQDLYTGGSQTYVRHNYFTSLYIPQSINQVDPDDF
ncbi:MAG: hypothetical protein ACFB0C_24240 [Leptolyngbyaceae cyanobacterium]